MNPSNVNQKENTLREDVAEKLKDYIQKLKRWNPPSEFGSASGAMTKKCIIEDLESLL